MIQDLLEYFKGVWAFERVILFTDSETLYANATGSAILEIKDTIRTLQYHEKGKLLITGTQHQQPFFRNYKYVFTNDGLDVYFDDTLTQNFNLYQQYVFQKESQKLLPKEVHVCNKDLYQGDFNLIGAEHFVHTSVVKGPHKDYRIITHFNKQLL